MDNISNDDYHIPDRFWNFTGRYILLRTVLECIVCRGRFWYGYMEYIIQPIADKRRKKYGVCVKCGKQFREEVLEE